MGNAGNASGETTLEYYVGQNAERTADVLWEAYEKGRAARANSQHCQREKFPSG